MVKTSHEGIASKVQDEISKYKAGMISLEAISSNSDLAVLANVGSKSYISQILAKHLSKEDRQYREKLLIARNASKVGYDTVKSLKGIHNPSERSSYASAGGTASYNGSKGIHALNSKEKSFYGQIGSLVAILRKIKASQ